MRLGRGGDSTPGAGRNLLIDAARFVAIAMVVLTHVLNLRPEFKDLAPQVVRAMLAFNMPLFAFVSGYVLMGREHDSGWRLLSGKAKALLVPYFAWIVVELPLRKVPVADWPARLVRAAIDPKAGFQMWFLLVLFVAFVVYVVSRAVSKSEAFTALVALSIGLLPTLPLPDSNLLVRVCWLYPFFAFGYLAAQHRRSLRRWDDAVAIAGLLAFPALLLSGLDGAWYRLAVGAAGSATLWAACRLLPQPVVWRMAWAGQRTIGVYGWQMVVLPFLIVGSGWSGAIVSWALVLAVALALTVLIERFPVTRAVFLGRWPKPRTT